MSEIQRLKDRIAELESVIGITTAMPETFFPGVRPKVPAKQLLGMLLARPFVTRDAAYEALFGDRPECDQPQPKYIDVIICSLRKSLRRFDIEISTEFGHGFFIDKANKERVRAALARLQEAA